MKLYLDDVRDLPDESFLLARSYEEAVLFVKEMVFHLSYHLITI